MYSHRSSPLSPMRGGSGEPYLCQHPGLAHGIGTVVLRRLSAAVVEDPVVIGEHHGDGVSHDVTAYLLKR